jgi:hypothetical protein
MNHRFRTLLAVALVAWAATSLVPARAQGPEIAPPGAEPPQPVEPPADLPRPQRGDSAHNLDRLFAALRAAPTADSAKYIEGRIWATWAAQGGDTATLLMGRVRTATEGKDYDLAIKLLTALKRDYASAMSDLRNVLMREPRHFGAWAGVGMILNDVGDEGRALTAFRRAVELHPRMEKIPELVKRLSETIDGRDL